MEPGILAQVTAYETNPDFLVEPACYGFIKRARKVRDEGVSVANFWIQMIQAGAVEPDSISTPTGRYCYVTVYNYDDAFRETGWIDAEATTKKLSRIIKWARSKKYGVEKNYTDESFIVKIDTNDKILGTFTFTANRKTVCNRRVVGTEVVPEQTREIVEWDCANISFLGLED